MVERLLLISLLLILPLLLLFCSGNKTEYTYYSPQAYVNNVNKLIKRGSLKANCMAQHPEIETHFQNESEQEWYEESYLRADIERFNRSPENYGWTFYLDANCELQKIHPSIRNFKLPFAGNTGWKGDIFYDGNSAKIALHSAQRIIALSKVSDSIIHKESRVGSSQNLNANSLLLTFSGGRMQPAARFYYVGDKFVINNRPNSGIVRLMGNKIPSGRHAWLETGDWLYLESPKPKPVNETFIFSAGETRPIVTAIRQQNDKARRFYPEDAMLGWYGTGGKLVSFFQVLVQRINRIFDYLPEAKAKWLSDFDIQLTLRQDLQKQLNTAFHKQCNRISKNVKSGRPFPAGITVMDGKSGNILAMSTYPWPEDIPEDIEARQRRKWLRNQNLVRHPIGSISKPFFYAAIMETYPPLLKLQIAGYHANSKHKQLLQCTLGAGYETHSMLPPVKNQKRRRLDIVTALARSSNKYTIELATLALAADRARNLSGSKIQDWIPKAAKKYKWPSKIWIRGQKLPYAPDLTAYMPNCNSFTTPFEQIKFRESLGKLTGVSTYLGEDVFQQSDNSNLDDILHTRQYDMRLWSPLISHLTQGIDNKNRWKVRSDFKGVSPERVNLAFNQITGIRDYITLLLGGGTGVWTNIQIAEAMSRLVTGRQVNATLVSDIEQGTTGTLGNHQQFALLDLKAEVREQVLRGTEQVVKSGAGTARRLRGSLKTLEKRYPKDRVFLFSKTGSATLELYVPRASGKALEILVTKSFLVVKNNELFLRVDGQELRYPSKAFNKGLLKLLRDNRAFPQTAKRRNMAATLREVFYRFINNINNLYWADRTSLPEEIDSPLYLLGDKLRVNKSNQLFKSNKVKSKGANYVFSLVKVPKKVMGDAKRPPTVKEIEHPETKVITIALHLEMGETSRRAVMVVKELLKEIHFLDY
ncbi:hypothetical protein PN36_19355 [Candidatus Thiomargarita nelsonii]|uniref:beta-lactamase n=1 Tax=Candidatus Thiomargarita nelsonii TaxID=1003181 RepID=A0A0A6PD16_9GAMM|nr:hypothetical protein PN36_19355 [Candidatus Thiomargarita nelsonii]